MIKETEMSWIVPLGSSILGAFIGGAFLLGGQQWNNSRKCRNNARIIFMAFMREASRLDNNIIRMGGPKNAIISIPIDVQTQIYHDHEKYLIQCINPVDIDKIYGNVKEIEIRQKSVILSSTPPDRDISYGIICSIQENLIKILDQLKPYAFSMFDKNTNKSVDIAISNLTTSFQRFKGSPSDFRRFLLVPPGKDTRQTQQ